LVFFMSSIAIIGAGFTGTMLAVHLISCAGRRLRVVLIEKRSRFGRGLAYSTVNPAHRLNVPAGSMSAFTSDPNHFLAWLDAHAHDSRNGYQFYRSGSFVPRHIYGDYLNAILDSAGESVQPPCLLRINGRATDLSVDGAGVRIRLSNDAAIVADRAVLALGNFPPLPPFEGASKLLASGRYISDPWQPGALDSIPPDAAIVLVGAGLTMVDIAIALINKGHRGPLHAISRHGLKPRRHEMQTAAPIRPFRLAELPVNALGLLRAIRGRIRTGSARSWQPVIDALRPVTQELWRRASQRERARFLRHLRVHWDVHRHRLAPEVARQISQAVATAQLDFEAGRVLACNVANDGLTVRMRPRGSSGPAILAVQYVINCTGPASDYRRVDDPLVRSLLAQGLIRPDPLHLGLDVDRDNRLIAGDGTPSPRLYAAGPVTKAATWEITAVPDLRVQTETLAHHLAAAMSPYSGNAAASLSP
jgi:uncharacterized NAD(P)/FAD-binding protein YdhS